MSRRVVITGLGPITAFGVGIEALWDGMIAGRSAISRIQAFDPTGFTCQVAAEMPADAFDVRKIVPKSYRKSTKIMCRDVELAVGAAAAAIADAGIATKGTDPDAEPTIAPERFGCHIGAGLIAADVDELAEALMTSVMGDEFDIQHWGEHGMNNLTPLWLLKYLPNMLACHVTIVHDCRGPSNTITCNEASSSLSLCESTRVIERGAADACLTGGAEYKLNPLAYLRQEFAERLAAANADDDPMTVARPYDAAARGTVLGEGGGILIVEEETTARERGATLYAAVTGFASTQTLDVDAVGTVYPADDESMADAIRFALDHADVGPGDIDAIVPFGSSIPTVDAAEATAIRAVFGERAASVPLVTTVPNVGNCVAGNSAVGLALAAKCLREQTLPARLASRGMEGLDAAACDTRDAKLERVLVTTASQCGQNVAVVLERA